MHSLVLRSLIPFLLVASFLSLKVEFCVCADGNDQYANCSRTITCGDINISYPFWGKNRPSYCGQPGYELNCIDNVTFINMSRTMFRILEVNYSAPLVRVARQDYWESIYPQSYVNTTVNSSLFRLTSKITNISFYYGCNISTSVHVSVPVLTTAAMDYEGNRTTIEDAVNRGFELELKIDNKDQCNQCKQSGGTCGRNTSNGGFSCFCRDQSQPSSICKTRPIPPPGKRRQLVIGISGAAAGTLGIIVCIIGIKRKSLSAFFKNNKREDEFRVEEFIRNYGSFTPKRYSYSHVKKITNSFKDQIGKGGYGTVYKGRLPDGLVVAVKVLSETKGNGEDFMNEVASIGRTSHVNIVTLRGFCYDRNKAALIYEFMPNGSLDSFIHNHGSEMGNSRLGWSTLSEIAVGIAKGLEYLHNGCNTRILHFDIKPQNILLDKDFCPKISDFGLSKLCKTKASIVSMQGTRGTVGYIAPEVFSRNFGGVSHKSDVYSYGMLVLEMVGARKNLDSGVSHTSDMFPHYVYKDLELDENENMFGAISEEEKIIARKMILVSLWCIQTNPSDRPSMSKVVEMLEGPLDSLKIAPKPLLFSSAAAVVSTVPEDSTLGSQQPETS